MNSKNSVVHNFLDVLIDLRHSIKSWLRLLPFPLEPMLDTDLMNFLEEVVTPDKLVLEYGAGASTIFFANSSKMVTSVESSRSFANQVKRELQRRGLEGKSEVLSPSIGITGQGGAPIFKGNSKRLVKKRIAYAKTPIDSLEQYPNFILIDGRFRLMTLMVCLLTLEGQTYTLILDDYVNVPSLKSATDFFHDFKIIGRSLVAESSTSNLKRLPSLREINSAALDFN